MRSTLLTATLLSVLLTLPLSGRAGAGSPPATPAPAPATDPVPRDADAKAAASPPLDIRIEDTHSGEPRRVIATAERSALLTEWLALHKRGVFPDGPTAEEAKARPMFCANLVALRLVADAVRDQYAIHPGLGPTRWAVLLSAPDASSPATAAREMFAFSFDRPRYERVDWSRLTAADFPKAALDFSYNLRFALEVSREAIGGIDED